MIKMETKDVIKLVFRQPSAHYRVGFTQMNVHRTLPLPPPSTIIGMIHNLMGCRTGERLRGFDIALCGNYESLFYQYQIFRNINKPSRSAYKESHPGSPMPNQVQMLFNVYLRLYIALADNFDDVNSITKVQFIERLENPIMPFIIGRREDLAALENLDVIHSQLLYSAFPAKLEFSCWTNEEIAAEFGLKGTVYQLGTFYELKQNERHFERQRFYYIEPQPLEPKKAGNRYQDPVGWIDRMKIDGEEIEVPVFFLGLNRTES